MRENVDICGEMLCMVELGNRLDPNHPLDITDFKPVSIGDIKLVTIGGTNQTIFTTVVPESSDFILTFIEIDSFLIPSDVSSIFGGTKANIGMPSRYPEPGGGTVLYLQVNGNPAMANNSPFNILANKPCIFPFNTKDNVQIVMSSEVLAVPASATPPTQITVACALNGYYISKGKGRRYAHVQTLPVQGT